MRAQLTAKSHLALPGPFTGLRSLLVKGPGGARSLLASRSVMISLGASLIGHLTISCVTYVRSIVQGHI